MYVTFDVGIITNQLFLIKAANVVSLFIIIIYYITHYIDSNFVKKYLLTRFGFRVYLTTVTAYCLASIKFTLQFGSKPRLIGELVIYSL